MTRPRLGPVAIVSLALAGIVSNLLAHLTVGGFAAGIWFLLWVVIPVSYTHLTLPTSDLV